MLSNLSCEAVSSRDEQQEEKEYEENRYTLVLGVNSLYISSFDTVEGFYSNVLVSALPQYTECVWEHVWVRMSLCTEAWVKMWVSINLSVREQLLLQDSVIWVTHFSKARHFPVKVKSWCQTQRRYKVCVFLLLRFLHFKIEWRIHWGEIGRIMWAV